MRECGHDLDDHWCKGLNDVPDLEYKVIVAMGGEEISSSVRPRRREAWRLPVPKNMPLAQFRDVRDRIEEQVRILLESLENQRGDPQILTWSKAQP